MKKKVIIILAVVLCCIVIGLGVYFLVAGKGKDEKFDLYIKQSSFGGADTQEVKDVEKYEVEKGKKISFTGIIEDLNIEVISCSKDEIKIRTSMDMSIEENGVMDLVKTENEFTVKKGEKIRLITPTTDSYDMYEVEYR